VNKTKSIPNDNPAEIIYLRKVLYFTIRFFIDRCGSNLDILSQEITKIKTDKDNDLNIIKEDIINLTTKNIDVDIFGFVDKIMTYGLYLILFIPFMTTIVQILTQIFLRIIKLIFCFAFAPIPIALAADDEGRNKAVQFFLFAASVGLEAVIIYLATNIYAIGLSGLSATVGSTNAISTIVALLFLNGMYLAVIQYGSQFAEKLTGGH